MIFYFLISIVFIAEVIITLAIVMYLVKCDKIFNHLNSFLNEIKPIIKDLSETYRKLSDHLVIEALQFKNKLKKFVTNIFLGQIKNSIGALTFWLVKKEVERHI